MTRSSEVPSEPTFSHRVSQLAFDYWTQRGCPFGTPDADWYRAEQDLQKQVDPYALHETWRPEEAK